MSSKNPRETPGGFFVSSAGVRPLECLDFSLTFRGSDPRVHKSLAKAGIYRILDANMNTKLLQNAASMAEGASKGIGRILLLL